MSKQPTVEQAPENPKYLTTEGIWEPPSGFFAAGSILKTGHDRLPSLSLRPLNAAARDALVLADAKAEQGLLERLAEASGIADRTKVGNELAALRATREERLRVLSAEEASGLASKYAASAVPSITTGGR